MPCSSPNLSYIQKEYSKRKGCEKINSYRTNGYTLGALVHIHTVLSLSKLEQMLNLTTVRCSFVTAVYQVQCLNVCRTGVIAKAHHFCFCIEERKDNVMI